MLRAKTPKHLYLPLSVSDCKKGAKNLHKKSAVKLAKEREKESSLYKIVSANQGFASVLLVGCRNVYPSHKRIGKFIA